jgi:hypothetical protein
MTATRTSNQKAHEFIANRIAFTGNNLYGILTRYDISGYHYGSLPAEFQDQIKLDRPDYIVHSYGTPIAWHCIDKGWFMPEIKYSKTTSIHQTYTRRAIAS